MDPKIGIHIVIIFVLILLLNSIEDYTGRLLMIGTIGALIAYTVYKYKSGSCCGSCSEGGECESNHSHSHSHSHNSHHRHKHDRRPKIAPHIRRFEGRLSGRGEGNNFDADYRFYNGDTIKNLYGLTGVGGDTRIANRAIWGGTQSKRAIDIRARADKYNFAKWFTDDELGLSERKCWWEHEVNEVY